MSGAGFSISLRHGRMMAALATSTKLLNLNCMSARP